MQQKPGEDFYNVEKVVKLLGRTPECQMLRFEALEGKHKGDDPHAPLKVYQFSVDVRRERSRC
jgi:hypothetical protein